MAESYPSPENPRPGRHYRNGYMPWIPGLVLVLIGGYLLLRNLGIIPDDFALQNWWALFILIPAFGALYNAWRNYQEAGQFTDAARRPLIGGLVLLVVAGIFLFNFNWSLVWPVLLILAGIAVLTRGMWRE